MTKQSESPCLHPKAKHVGLWTDALYRSHRVLKCSVCQEVIYEDMPNQSESPLEGKTDLDIATKLLQQMYDSEGMDKQGVWDFLNGVRYKHQQPSSPTATEPVVQGASKPYNSSERLAESVEELCGLLDTASKRISELETQHLADVEALRVQQEMIEKLSASLRALIDCVSREGIERTESEISGTREEQKADKFLALLSSLAEAGELLQLTSRIAESDRIQNDGN